MSISILDNLHRLRSFVLLNSNHWQTPNCFLTLQDANSDFNPPQKSQITVDFTPLIPCIFIYYKCTTLKSMYFSIP